jgi:2,3-bisphosphoglycerate-dependent phosphoglycerate mutase
MSKKNIWLIRHAQSTANRGIWSNEPQKIALSEQGQQQAQQLAQSITQKPELIVVSPFLRTLETAQPIIDRWPNVPLQVWPIQELVYLSPSHFAAVTPSEQNIMKETYWQRLDPFFCDGQGAESFANFVERLHNFHRRLSACYGFTLVIGHGQFFKAYLLGLHEPWAATKAWMQYFRNEEVSQPLHNCEILKL